MILVFWCSWPFVIFSFCMQPGPNDLLLPTEYSKSDRMLLQEEVTKRLLFCVLSFLLSCSFTLRESWLPCLSSPMKVHFSSVPQSCPTLCDPMNCSTPDLPVHHQLLEITQTHVHRVGDAVQPSHPLSFLSPSAPDPSQHQGLFQWVSSSREVARVLEFQLQHQSFQWTPSTEPGRLQSMGSLRVGHDWATSLSLFTFMHWRRKWQSTPVFLPGESQRQVSLVGWRLCGRTESDTTEVT